MTIRLALVGFGKIATDQHQPAIDADPGFELVAAVDPRLATDPTASLAQFADLDELFDADLGLDAIALCVPPQHRFAMACQALAAGLHVLLEKPPGITLSEIDDLKDRAEQAGVTLYASWHSRHAPAIEPAREWLAGRDIQAVAVEWREDVKVFHPGQEWIWTPGGLGVFDPGINALSILTHILERPFALRRARLDIPGNRTMPIAAELSFQQADGTPIEAVFDFRHTEQPCWRIRIDTDAGRLELAKGGAAMALDGQLQIDADKAEYAGVYARFGALIEQRACDIDIRAFQHVADAFMLGERRTVEDFNE